MSNTIESARKARELYARSHQGILSTISQEIAGYPFGSVVAFAPDRDGKPVTMISTIAEHTRNIQTDARVSLTLTEPGDDGQAVGRITLVGDAVSVSSGADDVAARYFARFPHAAEFQRTHDFSFYRIEPKRVRYIGGFGRIYWVEGKDLCLPNPFTATQEAGMIAHMNADHADAMVGYCRLLGVEPKGAKPFLAGVDAEGFDLMLGKRLLRIGFDTPVSSPEDVRKAAVALAQRARALTADAQPA